jgi:hypothetical protein
LAAFSQIVYATLGFIRPANQAMRFWYPSGSGFALCSGKTRGHPKSTAKKRRTLEYPANSTEGGSGSSSLVE